MPEVVATDEGEPAYLVVQVVVVRVHKVVVRAALVLTV
jgi:hypothetical protein